MSGRCAIPALLLVAVLGAPVRAKNKVMPIDIATVLKLAGSTSLDIATIDARIDYAKAKALKAKSWILPTLSPGVFLQASNGYVQSTEGVFVDVDKDSFWAGFNLTGAWDLGENVYAYLAAKQNIESVGYEKKIVENKIGVLAVRSYYDLSASQSALVALEKLEQKSKDNVAQMELQVAQGILYKSDLLLAKANLNHIRITVSQARSAIKSSSHRLLELLNIADDVQLIVTDSHLVPVNLVNQSEVGLEAAFARRPELMMLKSRISGLKQRRKSQTIGLLLPTLDLGLNVGAFGPYFTPAGNALNYYVGAKWDIPLGDLLFGGARKAFDAQIRGEEIGMRRAKNGIRREIQDEQMNLHTSEVRMELAKSSVVFATEGLEQSMQRQRLGTVIPLEVIRAQEQMMEAELDLIEAITEYNKAQYSLYIALGNNPNRYRSPPAPSGK